MNSNIIERLWVLDKIMGFIGSRENLVKLLSENIKIDSEL